MQYIALVDKIGQFVGRTLQTRLDARDENRAHVLLDALLHHGFGLRCAAALFGRDELVVLRRDHDSVYPDGTTLVVVLDRYLTLGIGAQIGHYLALATYCGQLFEYHVREDQRRRHQLAGLGHGITEHYALIAGSLRIGIVALDTAVDVGRLLVNGRHDTARRGIELILAAVVAYAVYHPARNALNVDVCLRAHLARNNYETRCAERLARHLRARVMTKKFVENSIGNLIRHLIGMSLGHRFGCK